MPCFFEEERRPYFQGVRLVKILHAGLPLKKTDMQVNLPTFFSRPTRGAALVEYGMLVGLVAVVAIGAVSTLGQQVDRTFDVTTDALSGSLNAAGGAEAAPVAPAEPQLVMAMTAATSGVNTGYHSEQGFGSISYDQSGLGEIGALYSYGSEQTHLWITGGRRGEFFETWALECDGQSWDFADAEFVNDNANFGGSTWVRWTQALNDNDRPIFTDGSTYNCEVRPAS